MGFGLPGMWENFGGWSVVFVGLGFGWWAKFEFIVLGGKFEFSGEGEVGVGGLGVCFLGVGSPLGEGLRGLGLWEWISGVEGFGVRGSGSGMWGLESCRFRDVGGIGKNQLWHQ